MNRMKLAMTVPVLLAHAHSKDGLFVFSVRGKEAVLGLAMSGIVLSFSSMPDILGLYISYISYFSSFITVH